MVYDLFRGLKTGGNYPSYCSEVRIGYIKHFIVFLTILEDDKKNVKNAPAALNAGDIKHFIVLFSFAETKIK